MTQYSLSRRNFLKTSVLAAGAATIGFPAFVRGQNLNSRVQIAGIGAGGKGASDIASLAATGTEDIVALCDVDLGRAAATIKKFPNAKVFTDFRKLFEEMGKSIDAVNVCTPDHTHAVIAATAMNHGKHVYCQKPLTQTIYEARQLLELANRKKIITQMGNQGSAGDGLRRCIELLQSGLLGKIKELHVWSNRPVWPQGMDRPEGGDPIPDGFSWDMWLGPAAMRPYKKEVYHPFNWRGWVDFGTGALGDMACHTVNMPFRALELGYPDLVEAEALGGMNQESYPLGSKIRFHFPKRGEAAHQTDITLCWYDGGQPKAEQGGQQPAANGKKHKKGRLHDGSNKPPIELLKDVEASRGEIPASGCLVIGERGQLFSGDAYGAESIIKLEGDKKFLAYNKHPEAVKVPQSLPRNTITGGSDVQNHMEWVNAIKANKPGDCFSRFEVAAKLTEIMLLGCVALRVGKKIEWDGPNMRCKNAPEAARFIKRENRAGWTI